MLIPLWLKVKAVTGEAINDAGGNKVCAATASRIDRHATFSDYANPNEIKRVIPLDTAIELDAFNLRAGKPARHIELAAAELGFFLARAPEADPEASDVAGLCRISQESADAISALSRAMADGTITPGEARKVRRDIIDAQAAFAALDARLARIEEGTP